MEGDMPTSHSVELKQVFCKCVVTTFVFFPGATKRLFRKLGWIYYPLFGKGARAPPPSSKYLCGRIDDRIQSECNGLLFT